MLGYEDDDLPEPKMNFNDEFEKLVWRHLRTSKIKGGENIIKFMLEANQSFCQTAKDVCNQNDTKTIGFWEEMIRRFQAMRNKL